MRSIQTLMMAHRVGPAAGAAARVKAWERRARSDAPYPDIGGNSASGSGCRSTIGAFTLTELLVVIGVLALLAVTQLPALTRSKSPVSHTQCLNNLRQTGQATMLYKSDNNDAYPFGNRCNGAGTGDSSVVDPTTWPMQLLRFLGNSTNQPRAYICPEVKPYEYAAGWVYQLHYMANRSVIADLGDLPTAVKGAQIRKPSIYIQFMEKSPSQTANIRASGFNSGGILAGWNVPPGSPWFRRHNGGFTATACDGHVEWLRPPPYRPGSPAPTNMGELGDTSDGTNPASSWVDDGLPKKLYFRKFQSGSGGISF